MTPDPVPSSPPHTLSDLLLRWRERRERGEDCSPEAVCRDQPQFLDAIREQIEAIESMEGQLLPPMRDTLPLDAPPAPPLSRPGMVAGYEILEELGRGGMGVVYKARQLSLNRLVALKMILHGAHAGPEQLARFKAEAEALARLRHPGVVQVYEAGEQLGVPFLSLEYVEGGSLDRQLNGSPLSPLASARLVLALARTMHAAHGAGIVHRDLKPANVLLAACGLADSASAKRQAAIAKITDFGLAKMLDVEGQTRSGSVLGTPSYMAPEQAEGRSKDIGPAVDIYALGAILYECLTGQPPFRGETALETLRKVTSQPPPSLSPLRRTVPRDLETICLKCLRKDPASRYRTAEELADDLQRFLEGQPIRARNVSAIERSVKWARRRPERAAILALVLLALPLLAFLWPRSTPKPTHSVLASETRTILLKYCFSCHGREVARVAGKLSILDHQQIITSPRRLVVPGDVKGSRLIGRIEDGSMPPEEKEGYPRLSSDEIEQLKVWVTAGAPAFEGPEIEDFTPPPPPSPLAVTVFELFRQRCHECHKLGEAKNGIKILNHDLLIEKRKVVVPNQPEESALWQLLVIDDDELRMPPPPQARLSESQLDAVRLWIEAGAPPFPLPERRLR